LPNEYTQVATVTSGIELVEQIAAGGAVDASGAAAAVGNPTQDLTITSMQMTDPSVVSPTESPSPTSSPAASPSEATPTTSAAS
jgi:hypothetical protein